MPAPQMLERVEPEPTLIDYVNTMQTWLGHFFATPEHTGITAGITSALVTAGITHYIQERKAQIMPSVFSLEHTLRERNEATRFYGAVNDMAMIVTDAWNNAKENKNDPEYFSRATTSANLHIDEVLSAGQELTAQLSNHRNIATRLHQAATLFDQSWSYNSRDNYRTEWYLDTDITTDSKGKTTTTTRLKSREVYENTDHYFTFKPDVARQAWETLERLLKEGESTQLYDPKIQLHSVTATGETKTAIARTIYEDATREVTDEEAHKYANAWLTAAKAGSDLPTINAQMSTLASNITPSTASTILESQTTYHYNTTSQTHEGPQGYRLANELRSSMDDITRGISELDQSISDSMKHANALRATLQEPTTSKSSSKQARAALDSAVEAYLCSFPNSEIDIDQRTKAGTTALFAVGVGLAVGVVSYFIQNQYLLQ